MSKNVVELRGMKEALRAFSPKVVERSARLALNKAVKSGRTEASVAIRDKFNLPAARVNKEVKNISMSSKNHFTATIQAKGRPISLVSFGAKWVRNAYGHARTTSKKKSTVSKRRSRKTGVYVTVEKSKGKQYFPNAFMGRGKRGGAEGSGYGEGGLLVFRRRNDGKKKGSLAHKPAISIASMFKQKQVRDRTVKKINQVWDKEFDRQLNRLMK